MPIASGLAFTNCPPVIKFPSGLISPGQPGSNLEAYLGDLQATFGFNSTPHSWTTHFIPRGDKNSMHGASGNLPSIGSIIGFQVGELLVSGIIKHADYRTGARQGTIITIQIDDKRSCLDRIKIHSEDLGQNPGSGIISIARGYRRQYGLFNLAGQVDDILYDEYRNILENGCTYPQILAAIIQSINDAELEFDINTLPTIQQLEANIGSASALRFKFNMTPLSEVVTRVLEDCAYDWYWSLNDDHVFLVNRKLEFDLTESNLISVLGNLATSSGLQSYKDLGFGADLVPEPRRVRLLGAHQEGFINSPLVGPIDGLDTLASGVIFHPAWRDLRVSFYDASGILRTYKPIDRELQFALNGIETWSFYKKYQSTATNNVALNRLGASGFGLPADAGSIAAQHPDFQSRLDPAMPIASFLAGDPSGNFRLINNRRDQEHNWVLNFYNRVYSHASSHYGRSYVASGILVNNNSGVFNLLEAAWCNLENQIEGQDISEAGASGLFITDYEINRKLGPLAPFKGIDDKVSAYCVLPKETIYGPQGDDAPAGFGEWTEDALPFNPSGNGEHYIPIRLSIVGQQAIDPRSDASVFEDYPEGTILCQLPTTAGSGFHKDIILGNLVTLVQNALDVGSSGVDDIYDLSRTIVPYQSLSGVAIPVAAPIRYGMNFPNIWASGNLTLPCDAEEVIVDDFYAPWNFPPQGTDTSVKILNSRAFSVLRGAFINASESRFAHITQVGTPEVSFDMFADQSINTSGFYGERSHGVTDLNISLDLQGFVTSYKVASYFSEFGREAPIGERNRNILNGIINPIDTTDFNLNNRITPNRNAKQLIQPPRPPFIITSRGRRAERVTIIEVNNALTFDSTPSPGTRERYRGLTSQQYEKPSRGGNFSLDTDASQGAICVDGFLNIDDEAIYNEEDLSLPGGTQIQRFFTGGRSLANATIVFVSGFGSVTGTYDIALENTDPLRRLADVPVLNNGSLTLGIKSTLATQAGLAPRFLARPTADLAPQGVFLNPGGGNTSIPSQVVSILAAGTSQALISVKSLDSSGLLDSGASITGNLIGLPYGQFVQVGDKGLYLTAGSGQYFFSNRETFLRFS